MPFSPEFVVPVEKPELKPVPTETKDHMSTSGNSSSPQAPRRSDGTHGGQGQKLTANRCGGNHTVPWRCQWEWMALSGGSSRQQGRRRGGNRRGEVWRSSMGGRLAGGTRVEASHH